MSIIHESFPLFIQPIQPIQATPVAPSVSLSPSPPASLGPLQPSMDASAPLTESLLRKRFVHEVSHGVPHLEPKRPKSFHP